MDCEVLNSYWPTPSRKQFSHHFLRSCSVHISPKSLAFVAPLLVFSGKSVYSEACRGEQGGGGPEEQMAELRRVPHLTTSLGCGQHYFLVGSSTASWETPL